MSNGAARTSPPPLAQPTRLVGAKPAAVKKDSKKTHFKKKEMVHMFRGLASMLRAQINTSDALKYYSQGLPNKVLAGALEQIRKEEVARFLKNASKQEEKLVEEVTRGMMNKFLKLPVLQLKDACKRGEQDELIDLLNELFDLERKREKS